MMLPSRFCGIYEVVAGIQVAAVLNGQRCAALLAEDAQAGLHARPHLQAHVKQLHITAAHILPHPLVENGAEKTSELPRLNRPRRHSRRPAQNPAKSVAVHPP